MELGIGCGKGLADFIGGAGPGAAACHEGADTIGHHAPELGMVESGVMLNDLGAAIGGDARGQEFALEGEGRFAFDVDEDGVGDLGERD